MTIPLKPKLLDLFCRAGGAGVGYFRAGFDVFGIDLDAQKNYPFAFLRCDAIVAMQLLLRGGPLTFTHKDGSTETLSLSDFTAIHASPPCQAYSKTAHLHEVQHAELVIDTRLLLEQAGMPYVIENVEGAPLVNPIKLCGSQFDLVGPDIDGVLLQLQRHRLFESSIDLLDMGACRHSSLQVAGSYTGSRHYKPEHRDNPARRGGYTPALPVRAAIMGIDWPMTGHELGQTIPPVYTEFIGWQLLALIEEQAA